MEGTNLGGLVFRIGRNRKWPLFGNCRAANATFWFFFLLTKKGLAAGARQPRSRFFKGERVGGAPSGKFSDRAVSGNGDTNCGVPKRAYINITTFSYYAYLSCHPFLSPISGHKVSMFSNKIANRDPSRRLPFRWKLRNLNKKIRAIRNKMRPLFWGSCCFFLFNMYLCDRSSKASQTNQCEFLC